MVEHNVSIIHPGTTLVLPYCDNDLDATNLEILDVKVLVFKVMNYFR